MLLATLLWASGCAAAGAPPAEVPAAPAEPVAAPWSGAPVAATGPGAAIALAQWRRACNRATCAPLAPAPEAAWAGGVAAGAAPRAATFGGGWAVAWDLPDLRSAFGVAGTGSSADAPSYDAWPHRVHWPDGSHAGYGPEGGTGPNELAYLRVAGQGCLYNVWSRLGRAHLESLLAALRFVAVE